MGWLIALSVASGVFCAGSLIAWLLLATRLRDLRGPIVRRVERMIEELTDDIAARDRRVIEEAERLLDEIDHRVETVRRHRRSDSGRRGGQASKEPERPYNDRDSYLRHLERGGGTDADFEAQLGLNGGGGSA